MREYCKICDKNEIDINCTLNGRWKVHRNGGENRFSIDICLPCFDNLAKESKE